MGQLVLQVVQTLLAVQTAHGAIVGIVRDAETSVPVASAVVTITDLDRATATDGDGSYELRDVPPGLHPITVRGVGYATRSLSALVPPEEPVQIDVSLRAEPVPLPLVDVRAPIVVRGAEGARSTAYPDLEISNAAVRNHLLRPTWSQCHRGSVSPQRRFEPRCCQGSGNLRHHPQGHTGGGLHRSPL